MSDITIIQGDSDTITDTISNLSSLAGYSCKMYIFNPDGTEYTTVSGTISELVCTYQFLNEVTKVYVVGKYNFETKIWDSADHVYTPSVGRFIINKTNVNDPS